MIAAFIVLSRDGLTLEQATARGRLSVLVPVPPGGVSNTFQDPVIGEYLASKSVDAVIFRFEQECDAHEFERLHDLARTRH
jgi:hypothetical protein